MQEIKCPKCGTIFQVDESEYAQIVRQVRDNEFKEELLHRERELAERKDNDLKLARMEQEQKFQEILSRKDAELMTAVQKKTEELSKKDRMIEQLKAQIDNGKTEKELAVSKAVQEKKKNCPKK